jgi:hypothetical protein
MHQGSREKKKPEQAERSRELSTGSDTHEGQKQ